MPIDNLAEEIEAKLEESGFSRSGSLGFVRNRDAFVDCVDLQKKKDGSSVAVNLGIEPKFLNLATELPEKIDSYSCSVRYRLAPTGLKEYWWPLSEPDSMIAEEIVHLLKTEGDAFFSAFETIQSAFGEVTPEAIERGMVGVHFFWVTSSNLAKMAAHAHRVLGNTARAKELAEYGLSIAGGNVAAKRALKVLLRSLA